MSNLTQFKRNNNEIRDPKQLPMMVVCGNYDYVDAFGFAMTQDTTITGKDDYIEGTTSPFRDNAYGYRNNVATLDVPASTSYSTILNITSGGGYLCNVQNTSTQNYGGREQGLRITVDGVVTTYPAFDYVSAGYTGTAITSGGFSNFAFYWGIYGLAMSKNNYYRNAIPVTTTLRGIQSNDQVPPAFIDNYDDFRIFSPQEFKKNKLPALRFETSCKVELYSESRSGDRYGAFCSYYLDSQIM